MKTIAAIAVFSVAGSWTVQSHTSAQTQKPAVREGPTLAETKAWLETDGARLMRGYQSTLDRQYLVLTTISHRSVGVTIENCVLSWTQQSDLSVRSFSPRNSSTQTRNDEYIVRVPLKDLEIGGIAVRESTIMSDKPYFRVAIPTRVRVGSTITEQTKGEPATKPLSTTIYVMNPADGNRVVNAIRRAAILCGAPASAF